MVLCLVLTIEGLARAQDSGQTTTATSSSTARKEEVDLEIQLHLLVASNGAGGEAAKLPAMFEPAVRQLRSSLPYSNYRWAATFINRVSNGTSSSNRGVAGPLLGTTPPTSVTPSFYDWMLTDVRLVSGLNAAQLVRLRLHFGARLPLRMGAADSASSNAVPVISYESTGIDTTISIRENEPMVIGTMSSGPSNEMLVLVISAKKLH
jgi:hypothetical protein